MQLSPPNPPWEEISIKSSSGGYLGYVYNDDLSESPVRAVTKVRDNKADPNLETMTYGLFSRCGKIMRSSIVKRGCRYLFFTTRRGDIRVLIGRYLVRWYAPVSEACSDYCLAADDVWFVQDPIPLSIVDRYCGTKVSRQFRTHVGLTTEECNCLDNMLSTKPNATKAYIDEIKRLERFNLMNGGYRYISGNIKEPFSWKCRKAMAILLKNKV